MPGRGHRGGGPAGRPAPDALLPATDAPCVCQTRQTSLQIPGRGLPAPPVRDHEEKAGDPGAPTRRRRANARPPGSSPRQEKEPLFVRGLVHLAPCPSQGTLRSTWAVTKVETSRRAEAAQDRDRGGRRAGKRTCSLDFQESTQERTARTARGRPPGSGGTRRVRARNTAASTARVPGPSVAVTATVTATVTGVPDPPRP